VTANNPGAGIIADRAYLRQLQTARFAHPVSVSLQRPGADDPLGLVPLFLRASFNADVTRTERAGPLPFTDSDWQREQIGREVADMVAHAFRVARRFSVAIDPGDGCTRYFVMQGTHAEVLARVRVLFRKPSAFVLQPMERGAESVDKRLNLKI
jgi:hypothetical protein